MKKDLAAIGLQVQVKAFPVDTMFARITRPGEPFDIAFYGWQANYPDPVDMLTRMLADSTVNPTFNDPAYQRKLVATAQLTGPGRYLAYGKLDIDLARNAAPLIAFGNSSSSDFFSARIGCQTYGPFGIDLAALCTKQDPLSAAHNPATQTPHIRVSRQLVPPMTHQSGRETELARNNRTDNTRPCLESEPASPSEPRDGETRARPPAGVERATARGRHG